MLWTVCKGCAGVLVVLALCAAGCVPGARQVSVVQPRHFKIMTDRMADELAARQFIDKERNYLAPLLDYQAENTPFGRELYERLVPDFLFADAVDSAQAGSFAAFMPTRAVNMRYAGFSLYGPRFVVVNMIALLDWDGDGKRDWLLTCTMEPLPGDIRREYYVVVSNPAPTGPLHGTVVAVYDAPVVSQGTRGQLYLKESKARANKGKKGRKAAQDRPQEEQGLAATGQVFGTRPAADGRGVAVSPSVRNATVYRAPAPTRAGAAQTPAGSGIDASQFAPSDSGAEDVLPGMKPITAPPRAKGPDRLQERDL